MTVVRIAQKQVGARHRCARLRLKRIDELIYRAGCIGLDIEFDIVAIKRKRLAVIDQFDVGISAGAPDPQLVRPIEAHLPGTGELDFLKLRCDDLDIAVECRRN